MVYIGVHSTNNKNDTYLGSGSALLNAVKKHGKHNFCREILFECASAIEAYEKEKEFVDHNFIARRDTYNIVLGGTGGGRNKPVKRVSLTTGKVRITDGINVQFVDKDLEIPEGWWRGVSLLKVYRRETGEHKMVKPDELQQAIDDGWITAVKYNKEFHAKDYAGKLLHTGHQYIRLNLKSTKSGRKYFLQIKYNRKNVIIQSFLTIEEALSKRDEVLSSLNKPIPLFDISKVGKPAIQTSSVARYISKKYNRFIVNIRKQCIGRFSSLEEAIIARDAKLIELGLTVPK